MKKAYVFPGQGSQFPGMAKDVYDKSVHGRELLERANEILGFRITDIMFDGTAEDLKATRVTQPAIFLHSVVLAKTTATEMQKCCEKAPGTMAAIISLSNEHVVDICKSCSGIVIPANYNCDGQVVISGEETAVEEACEKAKAAGAKRALPLAVSGAFHSPLMEPARVELGKAIEATEIVAPKCPIYQNVTAEPTTDPATIKKNLLAQLTSPVKWTQSVKAMLNDGASYFMEIGPGTVLQGLVKRIGKDIEGLTVEGLSALE